MPKIQWLDQPEEHDYPAAADYLELIADPLGEMYGSIVI